MYIESDKNPKIKNVVKLLEKSKERKLQGKIVIEGIQENYFALQNKFKLLEYFIQEEIFQGSLNFPKTAMKYEVSKTAYEKIAYRGITEGIVGVYKYPEFDISKLELKKNPFILVLESVEKPGNLGAVCRTADAFGVDAVIICDEKTDIYNPNVIRSSVGSIFNIPIISLRKEFVFSLLKEKEIPIFATYMNETAINIQDVKLIGACAILFGTEHSGISSYWEDKVVQNILIPMKGKIDSLNVSNAVAIASYEVERQRMIFDKIEKK